MSTLLIRNGRVITHNENGDIFDDACVYIDGTDIADVGRLSDRKLRADRVIDAGGRVVMPGLINAHHHLYSTFARGFAPPGKAAVNFQEILEYLWWKLDHALNEEDVYASALLALGECVHAGCTTVIDHHASPACRDGSLDLVEKAFRDIGLNGCLCYEVSDRNVRGGGVAESERFLKKCRASGDPQISALLGLHASMTVSRETLERCVEIAKANAAGFHVHAAEAAIDQEVTQKEFGRRVLERFHEAGVTGPKSIFVHGVHLDDREAGLLKDSGSILVHNPESNMNNAVGAARVLDLRRRGVLVGLGTDGMSSRMIASARAACLLQRHLTGDPRVGFGDACEMLIQANREICGRVFAERRGLLAPGCLADIAVLDYVPFTPLTRETVGGHLLYGLVDAPVSTVIARGRVLMENGVLATVDEPAVRARCVERAAKLWKRIV